MSSLSHTSHSRCHLDAALSKEQTEPELKLTEELSVCHTLSAEAKDHRLPFLIMFLPSATAKRPKHKRALLTGLLHFPPVNSVGDTFSFSINNPLSPTKVHSMKLPRPFL